MNKPAGYLDKEQIRKSARSYRAGLTREKFVQISSRITETVLELDCFTSAGSILSYASIAKNMEINTSLINRNILALNKILVLPRVDAASKTLSLIRTNDLDFLKINSFEIPEPVGEQDFSISDIDLVLVPMLAGDYKLNRVGYGMGYYDRLLKNFRGKTCGLLYDDCLFNEIPVNEFDEVLDLIVTEKRILER
jgi:5-formyltetrahydrofolate cyclo-ligase